MFNKNYFSSFGFLILSITIILSGLFVKWALCPLNHEKAEQEEQLGHQYLKERKPVEALKHFLNAARIEDDNISRSRRYRCVGSTSFNKEDKKKYYNLALKYNPNNQNAKNELKLLLNTIKEAEN